jgi:hypothetical protein
MPRLLRLVIAAACVLATAVAAPVASAAPGVKATGPSATPGDKADAAAIRKATIALHGYILAVKPGIEASFGQFRDPTCAKALAGAPDAQTEDLFDDFLVPALFQMLVHPLQNGMHKLVADIDALQLEDPVLRSGRAGWRVLATQFGAVGAPPTDLCARLDAWRKAGYPAASRPAIEDPGITVLLRDDSGEQRIQRKLNRSGERLRELGVSKRVVGWWTGDTLLDDIDIDREFTP